MLPSTARPTLPLKLVSLEVVQNRQSPPLMPTGPVASLSHQLQLIPGKHSELLVWIENTSNSPVRWSLAVEGSFPPTWCTWEQTQEIVEPHSKIAQVITFKPPENFFERDDSLTEQKHLQLAYQSSVSVFAHLNGGAFVPLPDPTLETVVAPNETSGTLVGHKNVDLKIQPGGGYLDFLPEIYRSDFMERFMTIFEQAFDPTVQTTDALWAYLDPLTAPKSLIAFLAQWVDWPLNPNWTLSRQRRLIKHAVELYRWRGTRKGLQLMLHLHTQLPWEEEELTGVPQATPPTPPPAIEIKESFNTGFVLGQAKLSEAPRLGGGRPYFFTVTLRPRTLEQANRLDEALIRQVIEQEKPAFCNYHLEIEQPG